MRRTFRILILLVLAKKALNLGVPDRLSRPHASRAVTHAREGREGVQGGSGHPDQTLRAFLLGLFTVRVRVDCYSSLVQVQTGANSVADESGGVKG